ncbi:MAG: type II toxin-antitoxin system PemK/MazF family toxin [Mycobacteriales bacterium]
MRPIHVVKLDKTRPALILTRAAVISYRRWVTVAPITSTVRGLATELALGAANGLDHECVISCDNIQTIEADTIGRRVGYLLLDQEAALAEAIKAAFDLY